MFDPLSIMSEIASSVIIKVATGFLTGENKTVQKTEVEKIVSRRLAKHQQEIENLQQIQREIIKEFELLAKRTSEFRITSSEIQLKKEIKEQTDKDKFIKQELHSRLAKLGETIYQRRKELGLITEPDDKEQSIKKELHSRLAQLGETIYQRRKELGLITEPDDKEPSVTNPNEKNEGSMIWEPSNDKSSSKNESYWERRIREMNERITRRRLGENISGGNTSNE